MTLLKQLVLVLSVFLGSLQALAQTTTSVSAAPSLHMREVIKQRKIADPEMITDKKLQADEGSLSKYSMKFGLSYSGPGIGDLSNKNPAQSRRRDQYESNKNFRLHRSALQNKWHSNSQSWNGNIRDLSNARMGKNRCQQSVSFVRSVFSLERLANTKYFWCERDHDSRIC